MAGDRRYMLIFQLADLRPERLGPFIPRLQALVARLSTAGTEQLFRSMGADIFVYLIRAKPTMNAAMLAAAIVAPGPAFGARVEPVLDGRDKFTVIEIGEDFAGRGFGRAAAWLQHH